MNENRIYLLYRTDEHLMADSKELLFIGSLKSCIAASLCYNATENQKKQLSIYGQSQCNNTGNEFMIESHEWDCKGNCVFVEEPEK